MFAQMKTDRTHPVRESRFSTAVQWLFALLVIAGLAVVDLLLTWIWLWVILLAMILAYHATNHIIAALSVGDESSLVWGLVFVSLLLAPVLVVVLHRVWKHHKARS